MYLINILIKFTIDFNNLCVVWFRVFKSLPRQLTRRTTVEETGRVVAIVQLSQVDLRARGQLAHTTDQPGWPAHRIVGDREQPEKTPLFLSFPYVCPEPVLVK